MDPTDNRPGPGRRRLTGGIILAAAVVILVGTSFATLRAPRARANLNVSQLQVETLLRARTLYSLQTAKLSTKRTDTSSQQKSLIADLKRIADAAPTPRSIRRLALTQYSLGDPEWRSSLLRLRDVPVRGARFDTEEELSLWRQVLDGRIHSEDAEEIARKISQMSLGWYEHLALAALYEHSDRPDLALAQVRQANESTSRLLTVAYLGVLAGVAGLVIGFRWAARALRARRRRFDPSLLPSDDAQSALRPVDPKVADVLYWGFILYLATFAVIRLILGVVFGRSVAEVVAGLRPEAGLIVQMAVSLLTLVPSLTWIVAKGRKAGLTAQNLGLSLRGLPKNIWCGICGYAVALPLVYLTSVISGWLFRNVQSPPHPVITDLVATRGTLYIALMFVQVAVLPPLAEELMFRGVFFRALTARMTVPLAAVLTSTLFAALHPQLPLGFLGIFVLGLVFNLLAIHRGSLVPGMVAHGLNNGMIFLFFMLLTAE